MKKMIGGNMVQELEQEYESDIKDDFEFVESLFEVCFDDLGVYAGLMSGITGVYIGIKPVAFERTYDEETDPYDEVNIQKALRRLGITTEIVNHGRNENGVIERTLLT